MPLVFALLLLTILAGLVAWIAATGWLVRSGLEDLSRRRRLTRGTDPVQLTAERAVDSARRSYLLALEALSGTLDRWYGLRTTLGIGTPLEGAYAATRDRADADPAFGRLLEQANALLLDNRSEHPDTVADLLAEAARMDALMVAIRDGVHRAARPE